MYCRRSVSAILDAIAAPHRKEGKRKGGEGLTPDPAEAWIDLDVLYGSCGALLGFTRSQVDEHSLRDVYAMLECAKDRETATNKEAWRRSLITTQAVLNTVMKRPKTLTYLADKIIKDDTVQESSDDLRRIIREAHELTQRRAKK